MNKFKIELDVLEFFKTGKFDYLKIGKSKEWVLHNFIAPEQSIRTTADCEIWAYGDIELHFFDQKLVAIYSDSWAKSINGGDLILEKWIFDDISRLNLLFVMKALCRCQIDFTKTTNSLGVQLLLQSGVLLTFENQNKVKNLNVNYFSLGSFCLK